MRIILFYFAELGGLGGVEVAVLGLAEALRQRGEKVAIVEIAPEQKRKRLLPNGIPVWSVTSSSYPVLSRPRSWFSFLRATQQFRAVVGEFRPDVVHVHYPIAQCLPVSVAHALPHSWKLVVTAHGSDIRVSPTQEPRIRPWQERLFWRADAVTAVSHALLEDAAQLYPMIRAKGRVIPNGVGPQWFALTDEPDTSKNYLVYVGRLHPVKGVDVLLAAFQVFAAQASQTELWIVGDGPERANLEAMAEQLGIAARVRFLGQKTAEELPRLYRDAKAFVLPSRREGLPIGLLEAAAAEALCVATRIPGVQEVIDDGVNGFLVAPESPADLAEALLRVQQLPADASRRVRRSARERVQQNFSEERVVSDYLQLYRSLTGAVPPR